MDSESSIALLTLKPSALCYPVAQLDQNGLAKYPPRNIVAVVGEQPSRGTSFCAVANIRYWQQNKKRCPDWQLKLPGVALSDHLSIHHAKVNTRLAARIGWLALIAAIAGVIVTLVT